MEFRADLHCHSCFSDGVFSPEKLLFLASKRGLKGLSITDRDTAKAYESPGFFEEAQKLGIRILPGVEISSGILGTEVHILGYAFQKETLEPFLRRAREKRKIRNVSVAAFLASRGMPIEEKIFEDPEKIFGRVHFALYLIEKGYVKDVKKAFELYLNTKTIPWKEDYRFSAREVIDQIHHAGGKAILAHPMRLEKRKLERELLELPFDGVEVFYSRGCPLQEKKWLEIVKKKGWLVSGGSDFHGFFEPYQDLGTSWVDEETFSKFI